MKNSELPTTDTKLLIRNKLTSKSYQPNLFHPQSIGSLKVPSTPSKTKDNVVHVGLSQLLLLWKVLTSLKMVNFYLFQNNNLLTVTASMMDVPVD